MRRALVTAFLVALVLAPAAAAHGGGKVSTLYLSSVTAVKPAIPGVTADVLGRDDQLEIDNRSGKTLVVLGYEGEPYLKFAPRGVSVNLHSPAHYLNQDRFARVSLPPDADAKLPPKWDLVTLGRRWSWHDHRIHWMSTILPPAAKAKPGTRHLVFNWQVPIVHEGKTSQLLGTLEYVPPKGGNDLGLIVGIALPVGILLLAGAATALLVVRRRRAAVP